MIKYVRSLLRSNTWIRSVIANTIVPSGLFDNYFRKYKLSGKWIDRMDDIISCGDNEYIPRVENAGTIENGKQIMHNGIRVNLGSYYGPEISRVLSKNNGVHEPQEERVFQEILKEIGPSSTMIELGSFWSFYSMWFNKEVEDAKNYLVEPSKFNIRSGINNFKLNGMIGDFTNAFVSDVSTSENDPVPTTCIDDLVASKNINHIDILHSDIQGFEYDMLLGATETFNQNKVSYIFISTHSNEVHVRCLAFLRDRDFFIISNCDLDNTYSEDGLIVAHGPHVHYNKRIEVDQKIRNETVQSNS